jgi:peptidoglycan/xylan/chitin deacetylase (PgdA/CDA1 family)
MKATRFIELAGRAAGLLVLASSISLSQASAQTLAHTEPRAGTAAAARADMAQCSSGPGRIGLARTVEIDTSGGPRFGRQYKNNDFLRGKEVVLTFDDGPMRRNSRMVLDALAQHCTKATFFMVGRMALADPGMVREIASQGHTIALHTWSHRNLRAIGKDRAIAEFELGLSMVQRALGRPVTPFFRFPYLADSEAMLAHFGQRKVAVFSIDADSFDFRTRDPRRVQDNIIGTLRERGKGIVLFHDIQVSTARGIRDILDELAASGFKVVHVVSKAPATSVASYDDRTSREFALRAKQLAAFPMIERAVVWPMTAPETPIDRLVPGLAKSRDKSGEGIASASREPGASQPTAEPQPSPRTRPQAAPRPAVSTDDGWQARVFGQ